MRTGDESGGLPAAGAVDLNRVTRSGLFDVAIASKPITTGDGPVPVRPVVDDLVEETVVPLVDALEPRAGDIIGFTGGDVTAAARLACDAAAWLADRGRSVTIVDACLENPSIAKALPEDGDEGVVDVVSFGVSLDAVRRRTLATRVTLVTAGSYPVATEDVVSSDPFDAMLHDCASEAVACVVIPTDLAARVVRSMNAVVVLASTLSELESAGAALAGASGTTSLRRVAVLTPGADLGEGETVPEEETDEAGAYEPGPDEARLEAEEPEAEEEGVEVFEREVEVERAEAHERAVDEESPEVFEPETEEEGVEVFEREVEEERAEAQEPAVDEVSPEVFEPETEEEGVEVFAAEDEGPEVFEPEAEEEWTAPVEPDVAAPRGRSRARVIGFVILAAALAFISYGVWWAATGGGMGWLARDVMEQEGGDVATSVPASEDVTAPPTQTADAPAADALGAGEGSVAEEGTAAGLREETARDDAVAETEQPGDEARDVGVGPVTGEEPSRTEVGLEPAREEAGGMREGARGLLEGPGGRFVVMVSSHRGTAAASRDARSFEASTGIGATIMVREVGDTGTWHRVTVSGGFPTLTAAREVLDSVKEFGYEGAWIERVAAQE